MDIDLTTASISCDVPSHAYTFPWAPNADWPRFLAPSKDIVAYINKVVDSFDLRKFIKVNHQVAGCWWDAERSKWKVKVDVVEPKQDWPSTKPLTVLSSFEDECDMLLHATGILNRWDYPNIPGLSKFRGQVVHTAGWPDNYGEDKWKGQRVAVIGSGASSIQTVPTMQVLVSTFPHHLCFSQSLWRGLAEHFHVSHTLNISMCLYEPLFGSYRLSTILGTTTNVRPYYSSIVEEPSGALDV